MSDLAKAAEELYLYGFPLIVTEATHRGSDDKGLVHLREFPTEKITKVVKMNMDTLYSLGWTQLRNTPYVAHIPVITERYYLFPIMDAYTNVVESICDFLLSFCNLPRLIPSSEVLLLINTLL